MTALGVGVEQDDWCVQASRVVRRATEYPGLLGGHQNAGEDPVRCRDADGLRSLLQEVNDDDRPP